jgi:hypothetical protein
MGVVQSNSTSGCVMKDVYIHVLTVVVKDLGEGGISKISLIIDGVNYIPGR